MRGMILLFAALALAVQEPAAPQDPAPLERRKLELELRRFEVRQKLQEAPPEGRKDLEEQLGQIDRDLADLRRKIDEEQRNGPASWVRSLRLEGEALMTHWDNDLELKDGFGWGVGLHLPDPLTFRYRRWDPRDELGDAGATVQVYEIGLHWGTNVTEEFPVTFTLGTAFGWVHLDSSAHGSDSDTGWIWTTQPNLEWEVTRRARLTLGADIDLMRTDFNNERTHTFHSFSGVLSLELKF